MYSIGAPKKNASVLVERKKPVARAKPMAQEPIIPGVTMESYLQHIGVVPARPQVMVDPIAQQNNLNQPGQIPNGRAAQNGQQQEEFLDFDEG